MYREIAKLIMYGDIDEDCILYQMGEIFRDFEEGKQSNAVLTRRVYTQIKRLLTLATDFGFDKNLWHNYLTFLLVNHENAFSKDTKEFVESGKFLDLKKVGKMRKVAAEYFNLCYCVTVHYTSIVSNSYCLTFSSEIQTISLLINTVTIFINSRSFVALATHSLILSPWHFC